MEFLRKMTKQAGETFKETADNIWEQLGDTTGAPKAMKDAGRTMGKYALTAQLAMTLNFPDHADMFRHGFNMTGNGPTGAKGFGGLIGHMLDTVADYASTINDEALQAQGFADVTATSTLNDLNNMMPMLSGMQLMKNLKETTKKNRGKSNGSTKLL